MAAKKKKAARKRISLDAFLDEYAEGQSEEQADEAMNIEWVAELPPPDPSVRTSRGWLPRLLRVAKSKHPGWARIDECETTQKASARRSYLRRLIKDTDGLDVVIERRGLLIYAQAFRPQNTDEDLDGGE